MRISLAIAGPKASAVDYARFGGVIVKAWVYAEQHFALPRCYNGKPEYGGAPGLHRTDSCETWVRSCAVLGQPAIGTCEPIPEDADGYAFIDVEAWSPDMSRPTPDALAARTLVRTHYERSGMSVLECDRLFANSARACLIGILEAAKAARPNVRWGHWSYPHWDGDLAAIEPVLDRCDIGTLANYPHYWLVEDKPDMPGEQHYSTADAANKYRYTKVLTRFMPRGPIIGTTALRCLAAGPYKGRFLDALNIEHRITYTRSLGCEAVIAWYEAYTDQHVEELYRYAADVLIPAIS